MDFEEQSNVRRRFGAVDEGDTLVMIRRLSLMTALLLAAAAAQAQSPDGRAEHTSQPVKAPAADSKHSGFHDLICKPNGTEDGFDCADEATPVKIVPIPTQVLEVRPQDRVVTG